MLRITLGIIVVWIGVTNIPRFWERLFPEGMAGKAKLQKGKGDYKKT